MIEQFKKDVVEGLGKSPKSIPSKYFYDAIGDALFIKIMNMPEYYPTRAELEIFSEKSDEIIRSLSLKKDVFFELIELGAGDGTKTKQLLQKLLQQGYDFSYLPIDISSTALRDLEIKLENEFPTLDVRKKHGDYFNVLETLRTNNHPKVILFLGSNIGNLTDENSSKFIYQIGANLKTHDKLILGVDLIKSEDLVRPAYDDPQGITKDFNLNLLKRINKELGGQFDLSTFDHVPEYYMHEGVARSYLVSNRDQEIRIESLDRSFSFEKGERIQTEISRKYDDRIMKNILKETDFRIVDKLTDKNGYFADYILSRS
ncbi:L-histidine N(alpha)-methyltransferase [Lutimonas zeaxanthinifaciens]|uniref:L-histidine N(alpha)-methyltransferase n=1 Tax=Lutimonas zeaxanthinifaciens TaxID=3060215 RepID=UPI00265CFF93|nr:L-histidine N(alpha)-methyltransferase [Lutimonas sp. YSD2104]WKK65640.1 L-histidine N(alpha)-methyltransferase [Lutimonas sp. YSD2104]